MPKFLFRSYNFINKCCFIKLNKENKKKLKFVWNKKSIAIMGNCAELRKTKN